MFKRMVDWLLGRREPVPTVACRLIREARGLAPGTVLVLYPGGRYGLAIPADPCVAYFNS